MILEFLEFLTTPCSRTARSMGFLHSSIQVQARYRRCKQAWAPHIARTRQLILEAVDQCKKRRTVVVLGAGLLHDIPLRELSEAFHKVALVDIVHPLSSRFAAWRLRNVEQISADVTGVMDRLGQINHNHDTILPISHPTLFVDEPELDLTLSVNLLSQLPHVPERCLKGLCEKTTDAFMRNLIEAHLDYLRRLPGHTGLITDAAVRRIRLNNNQVEEWDPLYGVKLPRAEHTWEWLLAPSPEVARGIDVSTTVVAYSDWKKASANQCYYRG